MAVQEGVIITARLAAVGKLRSNRFRSFPVDPERRQGEEELFGITLSLVTDHNYVFLRDCKQIEQEGGTLSEERKERIYSIWKAYDRYRQHTTSAFA